MDYRILYPGAYPVVQCQLQQGEMVKAESDAMISMSGTLDVEGTMNGGLLRGLARKFITGESFFCQTIKATRGPGEVLLGHALPGDITAVELDGSYGLRIQKGGFLASTPGIEIKTTAQGLVKGLFSGEGFFLLNAEGSGTIFLSSYGSIHTINLQPDEEVVIDNGHLVAWPETMEYSIGKASSGWISSLTSGEALVCKFRGPGYVLIQTRNPGAFTSWIQSIIQPK